MIDISDITKQFGRLKALDHISLSFKQGDCIALIGPNGSGKTTLIKTILGMVVPDSGTITFKGKDIANDHNYRRHIGYMPQIGRFPDNMSIRQVISMMKDLRKGEQEVIDESLSDSFSLQPLLQKRMSTLSGGTRQKVSALLAFLFNPAMLILDEPTAGLDPLSAEILRQKLLAGKERGKLILITSHNLSDLDELVSQVIYLQDGKILFQKSTETLQAETGRQRLSGAIASIMQKQNL